MTLIEISDFLATLMYCSLDPLKQSSVSISLVDLLLIVKGVCDFQLRLADHHNLIIFDEGSGLVLELAIMVFFGDFLSLFVDLFGLEVGTLEVGLALDVPFLDALDSSILGLKQLIGEEQVGQKENLLIFQQLILLHFILNPIPIPQLPFPRNGLSDLPRLFLRNPA